MNPCSYRPIKQFETPQQMGSQSLMHLKHVV